MFRKIPPIFRNFYSLTGIAFFAWMLFLDSNNLITRYQMSAKVRRLEREKEFYLEKIREVQKDKAELMGTPELLEKFARERYLMKKASEDIFIIAPKN